MTAGALPSPAGEERPMSEHIRKSLLPLVRRLSASGRLTAEDIKAVETMPVTIREMTPGQDLMRQGDRPSQSCLIIEGISYRYKIIGEGSRQILSYHISGDVPDLQSLFLDVMDHTLTTMTTSKVAFIPHRYLHHILQAQPNLARLLWRDTLIDGSISREWLCNIGRRQAFPRVAHLICELYARYEAVGLTDHMTISFAMTQGNIGDAMGLSVVHVNRVFRELRQAKLVEVSGRKLKILDWAGLQEAADFNPEYLHLANAA
jgi:CRP-like cAMP-binding protein